MAIKVERFGETPDGSQVDLYTLTNEMESVLHLRIWEVFGYP